MNIAKFLKTAFLIEQQLPVAAFVTLIKQLTVQYWASPTSLINQNTIWDGFYQKDLYISAEDFLYMLLEETTPTHSNPTCRKQKLVQSKKLQQSVCSDIRILDK